MDEKSELKQDNFPENDKMIAQAYHIGSCPRCEAFFMFRGAEQMTCLKCAYKWCFICGMGRNWLHRHYVGRSVCEIINAVEYKGSGSREIASRGCFTKTLLYVGIFIFLPLIFLFRSFALAFSLIRSNIRLDASVEWYCDCWSSWSTMCTNNMAVKLLFIIPKIVLLVLMIIGSIVLWYLLGASILVIGIIIYAICIVPMMLLYPIIVTKRKILQIRFSKVSERYKKS